MIVTSLAVKGNFLISTSHDGFIKAWNGTENVFSYEFKETRHFNESLYCVSSSKSHPNFAVATSTGSILVFAPKK